MKGGFQLRSLALTFLVVLTTIGSPGFQSKMSAGREYSNSDLRFSLILPRGLGDKTEQTRVEIREKARANGRKNMLNALLSMSSSAKRAAAGDLIF